MMNQTTVNKTRYSGMKSIIWFFIGVMLTNVVLPVFYTRAYAGGPTQPEVQSFSPIGVTDMVDPFTGDFHYNIPLMDIEGYPVNLVYNSGVSMEQEASWVGLGWNINTGAIVRSMRGLPDDFNGDLVTKETNQKPAQNFEIGFNVSGMELFGKEIDFNTTGSGGSLHVGMTTNYNTFNGFGSSFNFGPSFSFSRHAGAIGTAGFQLSGSSENGASWSANANYSKKVEQDDKNSTMKSTSAAIGGNTRGGLQYLSFEKTQSNIHKKEKDVSKSRRGLSSSFNLGLNSYTPASGPNMQGIAITASWKFPIPLFGADGSFDIHGAYSRQWISDEDKTIQSPAYGFFNLEKGQRLENGLLDFNRDNDGAFTKYTPFLPSAHLTPDLFSVQAHGIDGSFRGFRNEVGYVFDPLQKTTNNDGSVAIETGLGETLKWGVDVAYSHITSESGAWNGGLNNASNTVAFETPNDPLETFALQNASELSVDDDDVFENNFNTDLAMMFKLAGVAALPILKSAVTHFESGSGSAVTDNNRAQRIKRNQSLYYRTVEEMQNGMGISLVSDYPINTMGKPYHIGEITELATDGRRYVFGLPVYNTSQEDVTFAIGANLSGVGALTGDPSTGLVDYGGSEQLTSINNNKGIDHFYSATKTPAYAHSFMLTSILSDDYIDNDDVQGPSLDDLGSYVKFSYTKFDNFRWRSPIQQNQAYLNQGLKTDPTDDKASFTTGTKELAYVHIIETKNYVAVFHISPSRNDASSAINRHGGTTNSLQMQQLDSISLYSRPEYEAHPGTDIVNALPIQRVHFVYEPNPSNQLCQGYPIGGAKLTLSEVYFTYQNSEKMRRSSYKFTYSATNPHYNMREVDRWGNYQPQSDPDGLLSCDFPYTRQDKTEADLNAGAWLLTRITLPSGGHIVVDYEADDYAYVQNLPAMRMFKIVGVDNGGSNVIGGDVPVAVDHNVSNNAILVEMDSEFPNPASYGKPGDELYFRCLADFSLSGSQTHEYISGYGRIASITKLPGDNYLRISFENDFLKDGLSFPVSPITKSAIQYGRMHMSRYIHDVGVQPVSGEGAAALYDFGNAMIGQFSSFEELFTGPNVPLYDAGCGKNITTRKSFVRLKEPSGHKLGGGSRVKQIQMYDNWSSMSGGYQAEASYGQKFEYLDEQGRSSGVASYEPQIGGDENPWHTPVKYADKKVMAPDDMLYMDSPLMESQFPNPEVGYSRVVISDLNQGQEYSRTNTGKVVKEFYTAKDYPTRVFSSDLEVKTMNSFLPLVPKYQYLTASQGFVIENNDMHGKPKSEQVYAIGSTSPISQVTYFYKTENDNLGNTVNVIGSNGQVSNGEIGVRREGVADFRRSQTLVLGGAAQVNVDAFIIPPALEIVVPTVWPSSNISDNQFRSATLNKVITRFGLLERTVAKQDGSVVETKNLAYDSETGEVLVTQTTTDFNDAVYSLNFPAYWMYPQVAAAYSNINLEVKATTVDATGTFTVTGMGNSFYPGDELIVRTVLSDNTVQYKKGWVLTTTTNTVKVVDKAGDPVVPDAVHMYLKVIRSGHRNKQTASMASVTMLNNPLEDNSLSSGSYQNVLNAGAIEFGENWRTYCNCFNPESATYTTNPYVLGILGNWRPVKSLTYLTGRSQTNFHGNTNIRKDGVFTSFSPYYSLSEGMTWQPQSANWTFVSQVTEFSPNGMTLETKDALGRFSASKFGFNNTLTTAVAANTQLRQLEYASFEDNQYSNCTDQQVFTTDVSNVSTTEAHSGYKSLKVGANSSLTFGVANGYCAPAGACELGLEIDNTETPGLAILNGAGSYALETQLLAGSGFAALGRGDRIDLTYDNTRNLEMIITIHDRIGCLATYKFVHAAGDPGAQLQRQ